MASAEVVKGFVTCNKSDRYDARAIWTAVQQPYVKAVAIKTEQQQAILALHRTWSQLVKFCTAQISGLRGLLSKYGEVMPQGKAGARKGIAEARWPDSLTGCRHWSSTPCASNGRALARWTKR